MPLIQKPTPPAEKEQTRIRLPKEIHDEIKAYCDWAGLDNLDYFFEQSALAIFKNDKEWREKKKEGINTEKNKATA